MLRDRDSIRDLRRQALLDQLGQGLPTGVPSGPAQRYVDPRLAPYLDRGGVHWGWHCADCTYHPLTDPHLYGWGRHTETHLRAEFLSA